MTQDNIDILCVNTQSELSNQGAILVRLIKSGDISASAFVSTHLALHGHMRAIKDYNVENGVLTDEELFIAEENITRLISASSRWT